MGELATYQQFFNEEDAQPVIALLNEHGIPFSFKQGKARFDPIYIGENPNDTMYELKIPADQFEKIRSLLMANTVINLDELEKDHYLFSFTEEELQNVISNPDEWAVQDYMIAVELLKRKGKVITEEKLQELKEKKVEELAKPERKVADLWRFLAYLTPVVGGFGAWFSPYTMFPFYLSFVGVLVGISLWQFKKQLPDGTRVWLYQLSDRRHGKIIFFLSLAALTSAMLALSGLAYF